MPNSTALRVGADPKPRWSIRGQSSQILLCNEKVDLNFEP